MTRYCAKNSIANLPKIQNKGLIQGNIDLLFFNKKNNFFFLHKFIVYKSWWNGILYLRLREPISKFLYICSSSLFLLTIMSVYIMDSILCIMSYFYIRKQNTVNLHIYLRKVYILQEYAHCERCHMSNLSLITICRRSLVNSYRYCKNWPRLLGHAAA